MTRAPIAAVAALALLATSTVGVAIPRAAGGDLGDLLWDLQVGPLDGVAPPFTLEAVDGGQRSLAQFRGRPMLLYFWESG